MSAVFEPVRKLPGGEMLLWHVAPTKPAPDPLLDKLINPRRRTGGVEGLFNPRPFVGAAKDSLLLGTSRREGEE